MKKLLMSLMLLLALGCWCMPVAEANDDEERTEKVEKKKKAKRLAGLSPVARELSEAGYFTESEARPKARFYIFIASASWCGPCKALMPKIVEEYEENMKKNKSVSLVLLGCDQTAEAAQKYIGHYETDIPGVLNSAWANPDRPQPRAIPACFIMNAKGQVIHEGPGADVLEWKTYIKKRPQKAQKKSRDRASRRK